MKKFDSINVIPFIDIMLVLLAIVLATASFINQGKIEVNVPQSQSKAKIEREDIAELVTINKAGDFFYQETPITLAALDIELEKLNKDSKITIKIDAETNFQHFVRVTDLLTKHQLKKVSVVTTPNTLASSQDDDNATLHNASPTAGTP